MISRFLKFVEDHSFAIIVLVATVVVVSLSLQPTEATFPCYVVRHYVGDSSYTYYQLVDPVWNGPVLSLSDGSHLSGNLSVELTQCTQRDLN